MLRRCPLAGSVRMSASSAIITSLRFTVVLTITHDPRRALDHEGCMMWYASGEETDLGRAVVRGEDGRRMSLQEGLAIGALASLWSRISSVHAEDVARGIRSHGVARVYLGTLDSGIAPNGVLRVKRDDVAGHRYHLGGVAMTAGGNCPLLCHQLPVPRQDGILGNQGGDVGERGSSQGLASYLQSLPFREPESVLAEHLPQNTGVLSQVVDGFLLVPVQPSCEYQELELCEEGRRLHCVGSLSWGERNCRRDKAFKQFRQSAWGDIGYLVRKYRQQDITKCG